MSYRGTHLKDEAKQRISKANRKPTIEVWCITCGRSFRVWPSRAKRQSPKFCSAKCYGESLKTKKPWNKGLTAKTDSRLASGERHGLYQKRGTRWAGGTFIEDGYVLIWNPDHPNNRRGYIKEHRYVVEQSLGRLLERSKIVHHINGVRTDNRIENLQVMTPIEHARLHRKLKNESKNIQKPRFRKSKSYRVPVDSG